MTGIGPASSEVEAKLQRYEIEHIFMGYQSNENLARCYACADVFAFPSVSEVSRRLSST